MLSTLFIFGTIGLLVVLYYFFNAFKCWFVIFIEQFILLTAVLVSFITSVSIKLPDPIFKADHPFVLYVLENVKDNGGSANVLFGGRISLLKNEAN